MSKANIMQLVLPKLGEKMNKSNGFNSDGKPPESPVRSKRVNSKGS